ncbi:MAG: TVP38/TMEM64 family protein [Deferribacterales bacterium]
MKGKNVKKVIIISVIFLMLVLLQYIGVNDLITLENVKSYKTDIKNYIDSNYFISVVTFIITYIIVTALSLPIATVLTLAGGYFFKFFPGIIYINFAAVVGSIISYIVARYLFRDYIKERYKDKLSRFDQEILKHGHNYMLVLRLIPIFPFFLVNILAGVSGISLFTYTWTTIVGIFPASLVYTYAGQTLEKINSLKEIVSTETLILFIMLGVLSFLPRIVHIFKK